jgi:hypothetical protein
MTKPLIVDDYGALGKLIKQWTKGERPLPVKDHLDTIVNGGEDTVWEGDLDAFRTILNDAAVGPTIDNGITKLRFVSHPADTLIIRLPPLSMLLAHEADLKVKPYMMPIFYGTVGAPGAQDDASEADKFAFDDERIGDYTIANCA